MGQFPPVLSTTFISSARGGRFYSTRSQENKAIIMESLGRRNLRERTKRVREDRQQHGGLNSVSDTCLDTRRQAREKRKMPKTIYLESGMKLGCNAMGQKSEEKTASTKRKPNNTSDNRTGVCKVAHTNVKTQKGKTYSKGAVGIDLKSDSGIEPLSSKPTLTSKSMQNNQQSIRIYPSDHLGKRNIIEENNVPKITKRKRKHQDISEEKDITMDNLSADESQEDDEILLSEVWKTVEEYLRPFVQDDILNLEDIRQQNVNIAASNSAYLKRNETNSFELYQKVLVEGKQGLDHSMSRSRRGRFYADVWMEEAFANEMSDGNNFIALSSLADVVHGYDDDAFRNYLDRAVDAIQKAVKLKPGSAKKLITDSAFAVPMSVDENVVIDPPSVPSNRCHPAAWRIGNRIEKISQLNQDTNHPAAVRSKILGRWEDEAFNSNSPSFGNVIETDEISDEMEYLVSNLVPLCAANWRKAKTLYELVKCESNVQHLIDYENRMCQQLERFYSVLFPSADRSAPRYFKIRGKAEDIVQFVTHEATPQAADVIRKATQFATLLKIGDAVDALDRNGAWGHGIITDVYYEGDTMLRYVKVHYVLWSGHLDEWVSTFSGRILPRGMCIKEDATGSSLSSH